MRKLLIFLVFLRAEIYADDFFSFADYEFPSLDEDSTFSHKSESVKIRDSGSSSSSVALKIDNGKGDVVTSSNSSETKNDVNVNSESETYQQKLDNGTVVAQHASLNTSKDNSQIYGSQYQNHASIDADNTTHIETKYNDYNTTNSKTLNETQNIDSVRNSDGTYNEKRSGHREANEEISMDISNLETLASVGDDNSTKLESHQSADSSVINNSRATNYNNNESKFANGSIIHDTNYKDIKSHQDSSHQSESNLEVILLANATGTTNATETDTVSLNRTDSIISNNTYLENNGSGKLVITSNITDKLDETMNRNNEEKMSVEVKNGNVTSARKIGKQSVDNLNNSQDTSSYNNFIDDNGKKVIESKNVNTNSSQREQYNNLIDKSVYKEGNNSVISNIGTSNNQSSGFSNSESSGSYTNGSYDLSYTQLDNRNNSLDVENSRNQSVIQIGNDVIRRDSEGRRIHNTSNVDSIDEENENVDGHLSHSKTNHSLNVDQNISKTQEIAAQVIDDKKSATFNAKSSNIIVGTNQTSEEILKTNSDGSLEYKKSDNSPVIDKAEEREISDFN